MSNSIKIGGNSICPACNTVPTPEQAVKCWVCKHVFHGHCGALASDSNLGSKTMVKTFLADSTKDNFNFLCDSCKTRVEILITKEDAGVMNEVVTRDALDMSNDVMTQNVEFMDLRNKVGKMEDKLDKIMNLLTNKSPTVNHSTLASKDITSVWHNKEKLEKVKASAEKPVLIVKKSDDEMKTKENVAVVENAMIENNISIVDSYKNKTGDLMVVCESNEIMEELKNIVLSINDEIVLDTPKEIKPGITIVGLQKEYKKEEIIDMVMQNSFIKNFSRSNNLDEHLSIYSVRPLKKDPSSFQAFANVSSILREGIRCHKDKLILGLTSCKVYDRFHVKRCNNCQKFGHYVRDCPTKDAHICGNCTEGHSTYDCDSYVRKCINCVRENIDDVMHPTNSFDCPCFVKQQEFLKKKQQEASLNLKWSNTIPHG